VVGASGNLLGLAVVLAVQGNQPRRQGSATSGENASSTTLTTGPCFIKLGLLSPAPTWCSAPGLEPAQPASRNNLPALPMRSRLAVIERSSGAPADQLFEHFPPIDCSQNGQPSARSTKSGADRRTLGGRFKRAASEPGLFCLRRSGVNSGCSRCSARHSCPEPGGGLGDIHR